MGLAKVGGPGGGVGYERQVDLALGEGVYGLGGGKGRVGEWRGYQEWGVRVELGEVEAGENFERWRLGRSFLDRGDKDGMKEIYRNIITGWMRTVYEYYDECVWVSCMGNEGGVSELSVRVSGVYSNLPYNTTL